ncbi:MAG TPA: KOW motif-containing protein [Candidatus Nanoarchaeia archaeon]|nr:KOW motif-containing protein [Candidatus Nanoarchaeia archaeon]
MHLKRHSASKMWPIARKGTKYLVVPSHEKNRGIPLLIALRDDLKLVSRRKELEKILHEGKITVNGKIARNDNLSLLLFDKVSIKDSNKNYSVNFSKNGKLVLDEVNEKDSHNKISKVINKKVLDGKKIQINLIDGRNILSNDKITVGDSVIVNFKSKKIESILPVKDKSKVLIINGKHKGSYGIIKKIDERKIIVESEKNEFETKNKDLIVVG